jgi:hypothetical protein
MQFLFCRQILVLYPAVFTYSPVWRVRYTVNMAHVLVRGKDEAFGRSVLQNEGEHGFSLCVNVP